MFTPTERQEIQLFLALLFPWDITGENLYKTVTWTFTDKEGNPQFANYAAQSMDSVIRLIEGRVRRAGANVYMALGVQQLADSSVMSADGFPKAIRKHANTVSLKSIYLDIDVGKANAYATTEDAFAALDDFCRVSGMPTPTMEVYSGTGGLHVYWCLTDSVPQANWKVLAKALQDAAAAYGLKFDPQVTVNPAGILRVPNTFNHKRTPPTKVHLYREPGHTFPTYGYQQLVGVLGAHASPLNAVPQGNRANAGRSSNFSAGINENTAPPVDIEDLAINCGVIDDILDRAGNGDSEPLWNLAIYAASFTKDAHAAAYALSDGDPRFSQADTDKKLLEKINARAAGGLGWPTCEQFSQHHVACATCPFFAVKKTPFHHVPHNPQPTADATAQAFKPAGQDQLMPKGYFRNQLNHVYGTLAKKNGDPYVAQIINYAILDGGIDPFDGSLLYDATIGGVDRWRELSVSSNTSPQNLAGALAKDNGLYIDPKFYSAARDFFVAWVGHLQTIGKYKNQGGYGWQQNSTFAYDDKVYSATGVEPVFRGKRSVPSFNAKGDVKPWQDAMALIYGELPLEAVVAASFGAPLMQLFGSESTVLSIYSSGSGVGKTTAMKIGQAVWGHPVSGMSILNDTSNAIVKKIGDLKNLPLYWDEIRTREQLEKMADIVFHVTQGKGKSRLTREATMQESASFCTMMIIASNYGIANTIYGQTESTEAGGLRIFEIEARGWDQREVSRLDGPSLLLALNENHGVVGQVYAAFLAKHRKTIAAMLEKVSLDLRDTYKLDPKERFWRATATAILVGAHLANLAGLASFDIDRLRQYLGEQIKHQQHGMVRHDHTTMQTSASAEGLLNEMIAMQRNRGLLTTEIIPYAGMGKPRPVNAVDTDLSRVGDAWIQYGRNDGRIRARCREFDKWMKDKHVNPEQIIDQLKKVYVVSKSKQSIGAGVAAMGSTDKLRTFCYDFTPLPTASSPSPSPD
jgi:hypothetical protein